MQTPDENDITVRTAYTGSREQAVRDSNNGLDLAGTIYTEGLRQNRTSVTIHDTGHTTTNWKAWGEFFKVVFLLAAIVAAGYGLIKLFRSSMIVEITPQERQQAIAELTPYANGRVQVPGRLGADLREFSYSGFGDLPDRKERIAALIIYALSEPYPENMKRFDYVTLLRLQGKIEPRGGWDRPWEGTDTAFAVLEKEIDNREWRCGGPGC